MKYSEVLLSAARIIWKYKNLCIPQIIFYSTLMIFDHTEKVFTVSEAYRSVEQTTALLSFFADNGRLFPILGIPALLFIFYLCVAGPLVVIRGTCQAKQGSGPVVLRELFESVGPYFWKMIGLGLIFILFYIIIMVLVTGINAEMSRLAGASSDFSRQALTLLLFFSLLPWSAWTNLAQREMILANKSIPKAFTEGRSFYFRYMGTTLLMALALSSINRLLNYLMGLPQQSILTRLAVSLTDTHGNVSSALLLTAGTIGYTLVFGIVQGIVTTYSGAVWTLTYLRLTPLEQELPSAAASHA